MPTKCIKCKQTRANYNIPGEPARYCKKCSDPGTMVNIYSNKCVQCKKKQPTFNKPGLKAKYCGDCKTNEMVNSRMKKCETCKKENAYYNFKGKQPKYCGSCRGEGMIAVHHSSTVCEICGKNAGYNNPNKPGRLFCAKHSEGGIKISANFCNHEGCLKEACFNYEGETKANYCSEHKEPSMINVTYTPCKEEGCYRYPKFNFIGEGKGIYCFEHSKQSMVNLERKKCAYEGCDLTPSYNFEGKPPIYCSNHKKTGMILLYKRKCKECDNPAYYNIKGILNPEYCHEHKKEEMILCNKKYCHFPDCEKLPSFNYKGESPKYCKEHMPDSAMINVRSNKKCLKCDKDPNFNYYGENRGIYCIEHAEMGMVNVKGRRCQHDDCKDGENEYPRLANYKFQDQPYAIYCRFHKKNGMISMSKRCITCNRSMAIYNKPGLKAEFCGQHKEKGMVYDPRKKCEITNCQNFAIYSETGGIKGRFCDIHAPDGYICTLNETCKGCSLLDIVDSNGYCITCDPSNFKTFRLVKQKEVIQWLTHSDHNDYRTSDVVPEELLECNDLYRPDIFYDLGTHYVIVEVDENQHNSDHYRKCDLPRMINIQQSLALPTIFIRYNPDKFKRGIKRIDLGKSKRKSMLTKWIKNAKEQNPSEQLQIVYLFYDGYIESKVKYETIDIFEEAKNFA